MSSKTIGSSSPPGSISSFKASVPPARRKASTHSPRHFEPKWCAKHQSPPIESTSASRVSVFPWLAAAAAFLAALYFAFPTPDAPPDFVGARSALLEDRADVVNLTWKGTEDAAAAGGVGGDVVWSHAAQRGYMRFSGLAANDPDVEQYQLWIFDETRPEATPVDGGVFDVPSEGEVVVPIRPALNVGKAHLFAVTVEKAGGVVVSDRSRIAVLASVPE